MPDATQIPVTCWRYSLPPVRHEGWAIVHMDSHGFFGAASDFGNYAFNWTAFGDDFRKFLLGIGTDTGYLCSKLGPRRTLDVKATTQLFRENILSGRREGRMEKDRARELWLRTDEFRHELIELGELIDTASDIFPGCWEWGSYDYDEDLRGFAQRIWPRLLAAVQADLAVEAAAANAS